jgi:GT2 family glycosyltransferase
MENEGHRITDQFPEVSVVIATLGGGLLPATIDKLNTGDLAPKEILIAIPEDIADRVSALVTGNVSIVKVSGWGQVRQRAYGFSQVKFPYVLQIDDDVELEKPCLRRMVNFIGDRKDVAVCPSLLDNITGKPSAHLSKPKEDSGFLYRFLFWVINGSKGYQAGKISLASVNMAHDANATEPYEVEWVPGGCVLHTKDNLVTYNYYPFNGKAFSEDLFHSVILRRKGVKLYHLPSAIVQLDNTSIKAGSISTLFKIFFSVIRVMFHFASFSGRSKIRLSVFLFLNYFILILRKVTGKS